MNINYFSKDNKSIETYYWAGFLYRKKPFYTRGNNIYMKLRIPLIKKDLMYKLLKCADIKHKVLEKKERGGIICLLIRADKWKKDLNENYSLPFEINNETRKYAIAFLIGWVESSKSLKLLKPNCTKLTNTKIQLTLESIKKDDLIWFKSAFKKLFYINITSDTFYNLTSLEKEFFITTALITIGKYNLLSDYSIKFYNNFSAAKSSFVK